MVQYFGKWYCPAMICRLLIAFLSLFSLCFAGQGPLTEPWFTGPLLAPTPFTPGAGVVDLQAYVYWDHQYGSYDAHWHPAPVDPFYTLIFQPIFKFGTSARTELDIIPQALHKDAQGRHFWRTDDFQASFAYQLVEDQHFLNWGRPDIKLRVEVNVPLGKYDQLNPNNHLTDAGGLGSWNPGIALLLGKFFHYGKNHWITTRLAFTYYLGTAVPVQGYSVYGGNDSTEGNVRLGNSWTSNLGIEMQLTKRWVVTCDLEITHQNSTHFFGFSQNSMPGKPSNTFFYVAPGLEYNYSSKLGFIFGPSMTFAGRNGPETVEWIFSMNLRG